jgi:hypothetical protein
MKTTEQYTNRYGDVFNFEHDPEVDDNVIVWTGPFKYMRYGWDDDHTKDDLRYNMADPSGGPYICSNMKSSLVMESVIGKRVDYISPITNDKQELVELHIHLKPSEI